MLTSLVLISVTAAGIGDVADVVGDVVGDDVEVVGRCWDCCWR
jgi:hypothetical protein